MKITKKQAVAIAIKEGKAIDENNIINICELDEEEYDYDNR